MDEWGFPCLLILRRKCLVKYAIKGNIEGTGRRGRRRKQLVDDLRKRADTVNRKRKHLTTLCGEIVLEEVMDLSQGRL